MKQILRSSYKSMPWKNGGGVTAEIDRFPHGEDSFDWRLSQAEIQSDGEFSLFPVCERLICVVRGSAIILNGERVESLSPWRFSGNVETRCQLTQGPVSDLGLIFDPRKYIATMTVVEGAMQTKGIGVDYFFDLQTWDTLKVEQSTEFIVAKSVRVSIRKIKNSV